MCRPLSYIVTRNEIHRCLDDRHETGIKDLGLKIGGSLWDCPGLGINNWISFKDWRKKNGA